MERYQNVEFKKKYSIEILKTFFKDFPEEKRGRKRFKEREIQILNIFFMKRYFKRQ